MHELRRVVAVANSKGGVGKTTISSNLAGLLAQRYRVLLVDLDPQANCSRDLGYEAKDGAALADAISRGRPADPLVEVRPDLDVVPGGPELADLTGLAVTRASRGGLSVAEGLRQSLGVIATNYDLVILDTPPGERLLQAAALAASRYVLVPVRADDGSLDGLRLLGQRFADARQSNPQLMLLGVVLFAVDARAGRLKDAVRRAVAVDLGEVAPVFDASVRHLASAAYDGRRLGRLAHELEYLVLEDRKTRIAHLRSGQPHRGLMVRDVAGLAADYEALAHETLTRIAELERVTSA